MVKVKMNYNMEDFRLENFESSFNFPKRVNIILFWKFDHREIAKILGISFMSYIRNKSHQIAEFFQLIGPLRYVGSFNMPRDWLIDQYIDSIHCVDALETWNAYSPAEEQDIGALMLNEPISLEFKTQEIFIFVYSLQSGTVALLCLQIETGVFATLSVICLTNNPFLWEKQLYNEPDFVWCSQEAVSETDRNVVET